MDRRWVGFVGGWAEWNWVVEALVVSEALGPSCEGEEECESVRVGRGVAVDVQSIVRSRWWCQRPWGPPVCE